MSWSANNKNTNKENNNNSRTDGDDDDDCYLLPTDTVPLISQTHGRQRRAERGIEKIELKAAVKYGTKEYANPSRSGRPRWRYTHNGVVYITDATSTREITSWRIDGRDDDVIPAPQVELAELVARAIANKKDKKKVVARTEEHDSGGHSVANKNDNNKVLSLAKLQSAGSGVNVVPNKNDSHGETVAPAQVKPAISDPDKNKSDAIPPAQGKPAVLSSSNQNDNGGAGALAQAQSSVLDSHRHNDSDAISLAQGKPAVSNLDKNDKSDAPAVLSSNKNENGDAVALAQAQSSVLDSHRHNYSGAIPSSQGKPALSDSSKDRKGEVFAPAREMQMPSPGPDALSFKKVAKGNPQAHVWLPSSGYQVASNKNTGSRAVPPAQLVTPGSYAASYNGYRERNLQAQVWLPGYIPPGYHAALYRNYSQGVPPAKVQPVQSRPRSVSHDESEKKRREIPSAKKVRMAGGCDIVSDKSDKNKQVIPPGEEVQVAWSGCDAVSGKSDMNTQVIPPEEEVQVAGSGCNTVSHDKSDMNKQVIPPGEEVQVAGSGCNTVSHDKSDMNNQVIPPGEEVQVAGSGCNALTGKSEKIDQVIPPMQVGSDEKGLCHAILIIENGKSMNTGDVLGYQNRAQATYECLKDDFLADQLKNHTDTGVVVTVISMSSEATVLAETQPLNKSLIGHLGTLSKHRPRSPGRNYIPALDKALEVVKADTAYRARLLLLFLSNGKPTDCTVQTDDEAKWYRPNGTRKKVLEMVKEECLERVKMFGQVFGNNNVIVHTLAFGLSYEDYDLLERMADILPRGKFEKLGLNTSQLGISFSKLSICLSTLRAESKQSLQSASLQSLRTNKVMPPAQEVRVARSGCGVVSDISDAVSNKSDNSSQVRVFPAAQGVQLASPGAQVVSNENESKAMSPAKVCLARLGCDAVLEKIDDTSHVVPLEQEANVAQPQLHAVFYKNDSKVVPPEQVLSGSGMVSNKSDQNSQAIPPAREAKLAESGCNTVSEENGNSQHMLLTQVQTPGSCHAVLIIDNSDDMNIPDIPGYQNRAHAFYECLRDDFIADQLKNHSASDVVMTIISMSGNKAPVLMETMPLDKSLTQHLESFSEHVQRPSRRMYIPALDKALEVVKADAANRTSLLLLFLACGRPCDGNDQIGDDAEWNKPNGARKKTSCMVQQECLKRVKMFGHVFGDYQVVFHALVFGPLDESYALLQRMANIFPRGKFEKLGLNVSKLKTSLFKLSIYLSTLRTERRRSIPSESLQPLQTNKVMPPAEEVQLTKSGCCVVSDKSDNLSQVRNPAQEVQVAEAGRSMVSDIGDNNDQVMLPTQEGQVAESGWVMVSDTSDNNSQAISPAQEVQVAGSGCCLVSDESDDVRQVSHPVQEVQVAGPGSCHTVLIIDNSASMRKTDVPGYRNRAHAIYECLKNTFDANQLKNHAMADGASNVVATVISISDEATVLVETQPLDKSLTWHLEPLSKSWPRSNRNYIPALDKALEVVKADAANRTSLLLLFLSNGKPNDGRPQIGDDAEWYNSKGTRKKLRDIVEEECLKRVKEFGDIFGNDQVIFHALACGPPDEDSKLLQRMASILPRGRFQKVELNVWDLHTSFSALSSSLSTLLRTEILPTDSLPTESPRSLRTDNLQSESIRTESQRSLGTETLLSLQTESLPTKGGYRVLTRRPDKVVVKDQKVDTSSYVSADRGWRIYQYQDFIGKYEYFPRRGLEKVVPAPGVYGIALQQLPFAEGAERIVYRCCEIKRKDVGFDKRLLDWNMAPRCKMRLVAKEAKEVENHILGRKFHETFARIQSEARHLAEEFSKRLPSPRNEWNVSFVKAHVCGCYDKSQPNGEAWILVEPELDGKFTKWNNNAGEIRPKTRKQHYPVSSAAGIGRMTILEEGEEDEDEDEEEEDGLEEVDIDDIPQAFSHFTYEHTNGTKLVCDLQGVWNELDGFVLTDPAIHCFSTSVKRHINGATDKDFKGMKKFFATHECSALCRRMGLTERTPSTLIPQLLD